MIAEEVRPGIALVEKLGRIFTAVAGAVPVQLDVDVHGEITEHDVSVWKLSALKGLFTDLTEDPVTYVNAPLLAEQRGVEARLLTDPVSQDFRNVTTLRGTLADGTTVSVSGTLTGPRMVEKVVGLNGFDLEVPISEHMAFFTYTDRPGVVGAVGRLLGEADVNIGGMQVARDTRGGALVALTVDSEIPGDVVSAIATEIEAEVKVVDLEDSTQPRPRPYAACAPSARGIRLCGVGRCGVRHPAARLRGVGNGFRMLGRPRNSNHGAAARDSYPPRRVPVASPLAAETPRARLAGRPGSGRRPPQTPFTIRLLLGHRGNHKGLILMSEEARKARQALQESMDLREQGHTDD